MTFDILFIAVSIHKMPYTAERRAAPPVRQNIVMKKLVSIILVLMLLFAAACGGSKKDAPSQTDNNNDTKTQSDIPESNDEEPETIDINNIDWKVDEVMDNGRHYADVTIKNNSEFVITGVEMYFTQKEGLTEDQINAFWESLKTLHDVSDEDLVKIKDRTNNTIAMHFDKDILIRPGETFTGLRLLYFTGIMYVLDYDHYGLVRPETATISYIQNDKIYKVEYNYDNGRYTFDKKVKDAIETTDNSMAELLPEIKSERIEVELDYEGILKYRAYGVTQDDYKAYIDACKNAGFTEDLVETDTYSFYFYADNKDGYRINLDYNDDYERMDVRLVAPEEQSDETDSDGEETEKSN